jgi:hypothetical protein
MDQQSFEVLIVGLPESGKTSFIQALDEILQNPPSSDALRASGLAYDRSYLERDKAKFRAGQKLDRTERNIQGAPPELWFQHQKSGKQGRVYLPDVSGELYRDQWVDRAWSKGYRDKLSTISGILVFVRADVPASNEELLGELLDIARGELGIQPWEPQKASAQVQLVDVLQFIGIATHVKRPVRAAVLISAWDTVEKAGGNLPQEPTVFLAKEWPLISQYLNGNPETFTTKVYGVSALGGSDDELQRLSNIPAHERVKIVDAGNTSKDLTCPLRWLLQLD